MNHVDKPNSVSSEDEDNHLSGSGITTTLERHFYLTIDTALHAGKDLAVSLLRSRKILPEGSLCFSARASLLAPLATHSVDATGVTRYLSAKADVFGLSSLLSQSDCLTIKQNTGVS